MIMEQEFKKCPYCGEEILVVAKKCKYCGEWLTDEKTEDTPKQMISCPICSEMFEEGTEICPHCHEKLTTLSNPNSAVTKPIKTEKEDDGKRSFFDYYLWDPFFRHYFDFKGRLNRKHYWLSILVWIIVLIALLVIMPIGVLFFLITIIPLYATTARRLRDTDSSPTALMWSLIVSPLIMIWTCKPSEDESIRVDNLAPDAPQPVKFKKADKIVCLVYAILLTCVFVGLYIDDKNVNNVNVPEQVEMTDINDSVDDESKMPFGILSVEDALTLYNIKGWSDKVERYLLAFGYEYVGEMDNSIYWAKDCKLGRGQYGYDLAEDSSNNSSYIEMEESVISINAFDESVFKAWFSQIETLGYNMDEEWNKGNQGQDWNAEKDGEPDISIWNDYGDRYTLTIGSYNYE